MPDIDPLLNRWQSAGVLDPDTAARIRAFESDAAASASPATHILAAHWQSMTALILGAILLACGAGLFISAPWALLSPTARLASVLAMISTFHIAGGFSRERYRAVSTALHGIGTFSVGPAIALVGHTFNLQSHWPAAILLWAFAAIAGWILLRDQVQQTLALLLIPAWIVCEFAYNGDSFIGQEIYIGRILLTWAILYLTFFARSKRNSVRSILFAAAAIAAVVSTGLMLTAWESNSSTESFLPFNIRFWAWVAIAAIPLVIAAFHGHKGLIPIAVAILYSILLPWCYKTTVHTFGIGSYISTEPNFFANLLVAAFAVFLTAWALRIDSRALVNCGIVGFALAVAWFYWSSFFNALGRSIGLIGLGVLFLAGGWVLEKTRRRILARMNEKHLLAEAK